MIARHRLRLLALLAGLLTAPLAAAQSFPSRPITIVVPWPPGAATDTSTRIIAEALTKELGQPVTVENRPGANGGIGSTHVATGPKDGYRLITATADTHSINPQVRRSPGYDAVRDFEPIALFATLSMVWIARADLAQTTLADVVAAARQKPASISFGSWGIGSTAHLAGALLETATGIDLNHVPFQGAAPAVTALSGGHIDLMPSSATTSANLRAAGKIRILGIAGVRRASGALSDVPTLAEQGIRGAESGSWYGLMAPRGIPEEARLRLVAAVSKVLANPEIRDRINATGLDFNFAAGTDFQDFLRRQYETYGRAIRARNISLSE